MTVLKWVLIILGVLFLLIVAIFFGAYYWASNVESVKLTAADLEVGGIYPAEERLALLGSCEQSSDKKKTPAGDCACVADHAGTELTRFERLILTAGFEGSPTKIVGLTKGLLGSDIPKAKVDAAEVGSKGRLKSLMRSCGFELR